MQALMLKYDLALFRLINESFTCKFFDLLFPAFQPSWPGLIAGIFIAIALVRKYKTRGWMIIIACVVAVGLSDIICAQLLKPFIARPRPSIELEGVRLLVGKKSGFGFPSNHAANMTALAFCLGIIFPRRLPWFAAGALVVSYSRIYVGVHYPLDVAAGIMTGIILGTISGMVFQFCSEKARNKSKTLCQN